MKTSAATLAVTRVSGLTLDVVDLDAARKFAAALGLHTADKGDGLVGIADDGSGITLRGASRRRLTGLRFDCRPGDIAALVEAALAFGTTILEQGDDALMLDGPDGIRLDIRAARAPAPRHEALVLPHAPLHSQAPAARPLALSHVAIFASDAPAALAFYGTVLGLRLSDRCGDGLMFLHSGHGGDHHILALVGSTTSGLHHHSWEMGTIDAIGLRANRLAEAGHARGWGLGRHVLGSNFFHYIADPWGSHAELTTGLDQVDPATWEAGDHDPVDAFYLWGPPLPEGFIANAEEHDRTPALADG
ncbi:VOC family protein [Novosphingobium lentum]|uniref:VOC family protein n=1 Tax=Novosphingobium lentum TaxID=145287 RepID=UPI00147063C2|nr:VOC family protein [Novosphingobium lentum]